MLILLLNSLKMGDFYSKILYFGKKIFPEEENFPRGKNFAIASAWHDAAVDALSVAPSRSRLDHVQKPASV